MRILVTGGAGFIGSHVVDALIERGHKVSVIDDLSSGKKEYLNPKARFFRARLEDPKTEKLVRALKPEAVYHFAAQKDVRLSVEDPVKDAMVNVIGSLRILKAAIDSGAGRFIFASTGGAVYGGAETIPTPEHAPTHPLSPYGVSKLSFEHYLHCMQHVYGIPAMTLRFANVYGPRQDAQGEAGVVAIFAEKLLRGQRPTINGDGKQTRDFVYVGDVVVAAEKALVSKKTGVYNIGTETETSVGELLSMMQIILGTEMKPVYAPAKLGEERRSAVLSDRARRSLGWKPKTALAQGLAKTIAWYEGGFSNGRKKRSA